ncbi:signal peptide, CUB and EGF-like domain-containing protein 1 [Mercenaria mercenaria]|uniref:signal peptide, CUB and EGF-like domain-containing protein 1 n=1 Tax=Mercenaria mercenaria TaxID=6596 RepID=UPI00234F709E|nr:signal peptide, CUB and EGF-like domain-containing protein 1 [Mercenaria mercenaria]
MLDYTKPLMGHTEIMELLLENGASVNLKDNKGMIPLHYAAWQGKSEPVHILLHWKSPSNEQALGGETPLHLACQHGHFDVTNLLLLHQASPITLNKDKKSPLDLACEFGRYRVVDLLLRSNLCSPLLVGNLNDMTEGKSTCLHLAAKNGHSDIISSLHFNFVALASFHRTICDAGKYLLGTSCMPCARGTYKENVGDARFGNCSDCPGANTTESTGADRSALCNIQKCEAGEYLENKACKKCELDTYSEVVYPDSSVKCIACGTINGVVYGTENTGADNSSLCKPTCLGGKQFDSATNRCTDCPIESFKGDDDRFGSCTLCETVKPGYVSSVAGAKTSDQCDLRNCLAGEKIVGSSCVKCEVGTYQSEPRKTTCTDCGENLSTDGEGKTSKDDCQIECGPGLQGSDSCIPCPLGTFKTVSGYANCQDCPLDFTSNEARTECDVVFCSEGKEHTVSGSTESCKECQGGFFKDQTGNNMKCTQCPTGSTTNGTGQTACDLLNCVPGKYKLGSKCEVCPVGTYKSDPGNQECTDCADKTTTGDVTGAISSTQCDTVICDPGSYRQKDQKLLCTPCEIGKYQPSSGETSCLDCPNDEITLGTGKSSMDACVPECEAGQEYNSTTKQCFLCPTGTFKVSVGNTDSCQMCPKDKTTAGPGGKAEAECSQNKCPPGKYFKVSADKIVECFDCEIGTYSDREMQASCTDCPNQGTTQRNGTDSEEMCIKACAAGYGYRTDIGDCEICPKGQYNDKKGQNPNSCKQCPFGKTNSQSGSGSCNFLDIKPPVDQRINLIVVTTVRVALDTCDTTAAIDLIKENFLKLVRNVFLMLTNQCYNGSQRYCRGTNCDNIVFASLNPTCQQITGGKRDISHELSFELHLQNISEFITDECDGNANVTAVEVISQILTLYKEELTDIDLEIIFMSFENVTTVDLCGLGEELVNGICTSCPAGKYGSSVGTCTACAANTYQDMTGKTECKDCPDKSFTESTGSTSDSQCIPICQAGNEFDGATKTCSECKIGFFKVEEGNDQACTACISGKTTARKGSTSADDCSETLCPPGQYFITDADTGVVSCNSCEIGKYNPNVMADSCIQCDSGKTTQETGRKFKSDCIKICPSGSGYDTDAGDCLNCPKGQYNDGLQPRPTMCKYCPDNTTTFKAGESSCTTVVTPVPRKLVIIRKIMIFAISIDNCGSTDSLNLILTGISSTIKQLFIRNRNEKYNALQSFCVGDCINLSVRFPNNNPALACRLKGSGRRKRATTHEVDVELEFNNVSESTVDTQNNAALSTKEVINQIINNNKDELSPEQDQIEYQSDAPSVVSVLCSAGEESVNNECVKCSAGRYGTDGVSCELCPGDTYQDESGQSSCKNCPAKTFNDAEGATSSSQCKSWCVNNPGYCNNRGICSDTGRRTASCSCYDNYEGAQCASKKEPTSNMPAILGGAIGGGGALLIIILIIVGVFMRCSRDSASERKTKQYYDPEYIHNGAYDGTYDNFGYHGGQARPVAPYPSVGYPALGYKPDQSFEEGTYSRPYKYRPSIEGDDMGRPNDDSHFVWTA